MFQRLIQRVFGRSAAPSTPTDTSLLVPFVNRPGWSGAAHTATRPLAPSDGSLLVTLGWDLPTHIVMAPASVDFESHREVALRNLRRRPGRDIAWVSAPLPGESPTPIFARLGGWLTASDLWDPSFLRQSLTLLNSQVAYFAVPTRESMLMCAEPGPLQLMALWKMAQNSKDEFLLGVHIYAFDGTTLTRHDPPDDERDFDDSSFEDDDDFDEEEEDEEEEEGDIEPDAGFVPSLLKARAADGVTTAFMVLTEPDIPHVKAKMRLMLGNVIDELRADPEFGGTIRFIINPDLLPRTPAHETELRDLAAAETQRIEQMGLLTHRGTSITIEARIGME